MKTALFVCDTSWSTGNIAKGLIASLPNWLIEMHDWSMPFFGWPHDAVVCLSMTGPARNPAIADHVASVLCGPGEMDLPEMRDLALPDGAVLAGVSSECTDMLRDAFPTTAVHRTPGFAHPAIFRHGGERSGPLRRAGFVGFPVPQNIQVSGHVKRPEMFLEICEAAGLEPVFTEKRYSYETMPDFYASVDVVISTSSREGGPFSPLEAIACGVPALTTNVGLMRDLALPGKFDTVREAVMLLREVEDDTLFFAEQQWPIAKQHTATAVAAWDTFLKHVADWRALQSR